MLVPVEEVGKGHVADRAYCVDLLLLLLPLMLLYFNPRMALVLVLLSRILILLRLLGEKNVKQFIIIFLLGNPYLVD